jgi:anti-sigma B factor antagonist
MFLNKKQIKPGIWVLELSGRVQMGADCKRIDQEVEHHISIKEHHLILDMAAVDHIDSAVIGQIVKSFSRLTKTGGTLRLAACSPMVQGVLTMTQVNRVISMYPTAQEASEGLPPAK